MAIHPNGLPGFLVKRFIDGFSSTPYAKPKWFNRLGDKKPTNKQLKELEYSTWLEF